MKKSVKCSDFVTYFCAKLFSDKNFLEQDFLYREVEENLFNVHPSLGCLSQNPFLVKCQNYIPKPPLFNSATVIILKKIYITHLHSRRFTEVQNNKCE